jgi:glycosyltransferase involved in cell wall biosynthesis
VFEGSRVAVVVPAFNEELLIGRVIETMPDFVDHIYVVDDASTDATAAEVQKYVDVDPERVVLIRHDRNQGVGGAIATGYEAARDGQCDVAAVMAGDAQMDPNELGNMIAPVVRGECDFTKGNRLVSGDAWDVMPRTRYLGNAVLSLLTKIVSGYWHIADSQSGYTAASRTVLDALDWSRMHRRYGQPNDLLTRLNVYGFRVRDIPVRPIYGIGEMSGIRPFLLAPRLVWLLIRLFFHRMWHKYVIRDFHPLLFFYVSGFVLLPAGAGLGGYLLYRRLFEGPIAGTSALLAAFLVITGLQFLFFAMWFDMDYNKDLR